MTEVIPKQKDYQEDSSEHLDIVEPKKPEVFDPSPLHIATQQLVGATHSMELATLLRRQYVDTVEEVERGYQTGRIRSGERESLRPTDELLNFTRDRNGEQREYSNLVLSGVDGMGNGYCVFETERDLDSQTGVTPVDYLVIRFGADGRMTEPIVQEVVNKGRTSLTLYDPVFDTKFDKTPDSEPIVNPHAPNSPIVPDGYRKIVLDWFDDIESGPTNVKAKTFGSNSLDAARSNIRQPEGQTFYQLEQTRPERRAKIEALADEILKPENVAKREMLAVFTYRGVGDTKQLVRNRELPPPGDGPKNVVALGVSPDYGMTFAIRTYDETSVSDHPGSYSAYVGDINSGEITKMDINWAWQAPDGRRYIKSQNFNDQGELYISWLVGETGAGYDVQVTRDFSQPGKEVRAIDDLFNTITERSGGRELSEIVLDERCGVLAENILRSDVSVEVISTMMSKYIERKPELGDGGDLEKQEFEHAIGAFVLDGEVYAIRSKRDDGSGNPVDYSVVSGNIATGTIVELPVKWVWKNDGNNRFFLGFDDDNPDRVDSPDGTYVIGGVQVNKIIQVSCKLKDGSLVPDTWRYDTTGDTPRPFGVLLEKMSEKIVELAELEDRRALGSTALADPN